MWIAVKKRWLRWDRIGPFLFYFAFCFIFLSLLLFYFNIGCKTIVSCGISVKTSCQNLTFSACKWNNVALRWDVGFYCCNDLLFISFLVKKKKKKKERKKKKKKTTQILHDSLYLSLVESQGHLYLDKMMVLFLVLRIYLKLVVFFSKKKVKKKQYRWCWPRHINDRFFFR